MIKIKKKSTKNFTISLIKKVQTEYYPFDLANGLDTIIKSDDYARVHLKANGQEKFIWKNEKGSQIIVSYYSHVNSITISQTFNGLPKKLAKDIEFCLEDSYRKLNDVIGKLSQRLGPPYIASTRELLVEIESDNSAEITRLLLPIMQRLHRKIENINRIDVDISEISSSVKCIEFRYFES